MSTYFTAMVINHKEIIPGVWKMELAAPEIAKTVRPGQFIQLYPPDERNLLARPISLSSISKESVTVVYWVVGQGTRQFSYLQVNDTLRVMGPLGNGFTFSAAGTKNIIVGGGLGIPPLLELAKRLHGNTTVLLGVSGCSFYGGGLSEIRIGSPYCKPVGKVRFLWDRVRFIGDYCSVSRRDVCLWASSDAAVCFEVAKGHSIPIQVSLEERMACGLGACLGCGVKIQKPGAQDWKYLRVCKDGPVFSGEEVVWNG